MSAYKTKEKINRQSFFFNFKIFRRKKNTTKINPSKRTMLAHFIPIRAREIVVALHNLAEDLLVVGAVEWRKATKSGGEKEQSVQS
jgi:hypothetical protein